MPVSVTYREISERFGIGIEGARLKATRRAAKGLWRIVPGNHPQDIVRVEVPDEEWVHPNAPRPTGPHEGEPPSTPTNRPPQEAQRRDTNNLEALVEIVSQLTAQSQAITDRLIQAECRKAEAEKDAAIAQTALQEAEKRFAAVQELHLSQLKAMQERMEVEQGTGSLLITHQISRRPRGVAGR